MKILNSVFKAIVLGLCIYIVMEPWFITEHPVLTIIGVILIVGLVLIIARTEKVDDKEVKELVDNEIYLRIKEKIPPDVFATLEGETDEEKVINYVRQGVEEECVTKE